MKKKLVTGATVQVKGDDIAKLNTTNALEAMASSSPGVQITQSSSQPGKGFSVTIVWSNAVRAARGETSYMVDRKDHAIIVAAPIQNLSYIKDNDQKTSNTDNIQVLRYEPRCQSQALLRLLQQHYILRVPLI